MDIEELMELEEVEHLFPYISERRVRERIDHFLIFSDEQFQRRFRVSKEAVMVILAKIETLITPRSIRNNAVPAKNKILLALRFYASANMLISVADFSGISESSASVFIKEVTYAICSLRKDFIKMPDAAELNEIQLDFYSIARFPHVVGAIDCTHVRMQSPGGENAENFRNRKNYFSINVQTICDANLKMRDIVARWPGATHDQTIFNNSKIRSRFENRDFKTGMLLGDSGYQNRFYLLTPLQNPVTESEHLYNESHIRTRNVVERQNGVWKRRFPVLRLEMRLKLETIQAVILATAILHNFAIEMGEEDPPIDVEVTHDDHVPVAPLGNGDGNRRTSLIRDYFSRI